MKIAFLADEITSFIKTHDSTWAIMQAAYQAGDEPYYALASSLALDSEKPLAKFTKLDQEFFDFQEINPSKTLNLPITDGADTRYRPTYIYLDDFDIVFMRKDPPVDIDYINQAQTLTLCRKARVVNNPKALLEHNEKLSIFNFPKLIAPTVVTNSKEEIKNFLHDHGKTVIKPINNMAGTGIFTIDSKNKNLDDKLDTSLATEPRVIAQKYIPEVKSQGDKRIILINGKPAGAILRIPAENDFRANLAVSGKFEKYKLKKKDLELCSKLKKFLIDNGVYLAGIDVIGDYLTEINITSPTCLQEINRLDKLKGKDLLENVLLKAVKRKL